MFWSKWFICWRDSYMEGAVWGCFLSHYLLLSDGRAMQILVWVILWKNPLVSQCNSAYCQATHWYHNSCNQAIKQLPFQTSVPLPLPSSQAQSLGPALLHLPAQECLWTEDIIISSSIYNVSRVSQSHRWLPKPYLMNFWWHYIFVSIYGYKYPCLRTL